MGDSDGDALPVLMCKLRALPAGRGIPTWFLTSGALGRRLVIVAAGGQELFFIKLRGDNSLVRMTPELRAELFRVYGVETTQRRAHLCTHCGQQTDSADMLRHWGGRSPCSMFFESVESRLQLLAAAKAGLAADRCASTQEQVEVLHADVIQGLHIAQDTQQNTTLIQEQNVDLMAAVLGLRQEIIAGSLQSQQPLLAIAAPEAEEPPEGLTCPVSKQLFVNPVVGEDGISYSQESLDRWFSNCRAQGKPLSLPVSRRPCNPRLLRPNRALADLVDQWREAHPPSAEVCFFRVPAQGAAGRER